MRIRRVEVTTVACVIVALAFLGFVALKNRRNYGQTECVYNLKMIHLDYVNYLADHGKFLTQVTNQSGTIALGADTHPAVDFKSMVLGESPFQVGAPVHYLVCPLDKAVKPGQPDKLANTNLSYFLSLNPPSENGKWILSGNRNLSVSGESRKVVWNRAIGLHGETGYLLFLDGSVSQVGNVELEKSFNQGGNTTNQIAIP